MSDHVTMLTERRNALEKELLEMQKAFESKKEEFLKISGALEMLEILGKEQAAAEITD